MAPHTDDLRIRRIDALVPPAELIAGIPCTDEVSATVADARRAAARRRRYPARRRAAKSGPRPWAGGRPEWPATGDII